MTVAFVMAPGASASPSSAPSTPVADKGSTSPDTASTSARVPKAAQVKGDFGRQKIRVGVQIKNGAYVPPATTTSGTQVTIVETGPNADDAIRTQEGGTCTTAGPNPDAATTTETICTFSVFEQPPGDYTAEPGDTVTFTQTTVNDGLVIDSSTKTVGPCVTENADGQDIGPACPGEGQYTHVLFTDPGLPPVAVDDSRTTGPSQPVDITVLENDDTKGAPPTVTKTTDPAHGSVSLNGTTFTYTPEHGFAGADQFDYTLTTANGSSRATVTITVKAAPATSSASSSAAASQAPLAATGTRSSSLLGLGATLIAFGSMIVFAARRRYGPRHAPR